MDPGNFAVPGALLRTAGDGLAGEVEDLDRLPSAPVPGRSRWYDGAVLAFVLLVIFAVGVAPALVVGVGGVGLLLGMRFAVPYLARNEDAAILTAEGLPPDTPLAPVAQPRLLLTAGRLGRRRGMQDLAALAVAMGCAALVVPLFGGRILMRDESLNNWQRYAVLGSVAFAALVCGPLVAWALRRVVRDTETERKLAAIGTGLCCLGVGVAGFMPWLAAFAALLFLGESFVYVAARGVVRCVNSTVPARERPAAWWLLLIYAELVGALVGGVLRDLVSARETPRWALG